MQEVFREERHAAGVEGRWGAARLWVRTIAGLCRTAARQHVDAMRQDFVYAVRTLRRTPGLSLVAIVSLALGIGANTAIFGFLNTLFLRAPMEVAAPGALVGVYARTEGRILPERLTYQDFEALRDGSRSLADVAAHTATWVWMASDQREPIELYADAVSVNYFSVLGVRPALGRLFEASDRTGAPVAVLAHHVWQAQFGGDPSILGRHVSLNQRLFTVVGVAPEGFTSIHAGVSRGLWIPTGTYGGWTAGDSFDLVGRLAPGRTRDEAQAELAVLLRAARAPAAPDQSPETPLVVSELRGVHPFDRANFARTPLLLAGVVAFLLLIACANLAGLLHARSSSRRHEMAVRVSLGATRGRLVRQLLTESVLLSAAGALAALLVAVWASRLIEIHFAYLFDRLQLGFDQRVLLFTLGVALVSGIGFGLAPALEASRVTPFGALRNGRDARAARGSPLRYGAPRRPGRLVGRAPRRRAADGAEPFARRRQARIRAGRRRALSPAPEPKPLHG